MWVIPKEGCFVPPPPAPIVAGDDNDNVDMPDEVDVADLSGSGAYMGVDDDDDRLSWVLSMCSSQCSEEDVWGDGDDQELPGVSRVATDAELATQRTTLIRLEHTMNFEPVNNKKEPSLFDGPMVGLNERVRRLTRGQGNDKVWHRLRPCSISSTGAVKIARAANLEPHADGTPVKAALTFLTETLSKTICNGHFHEFGDFEDIEV